MKFGRKATSFFLGRKKTALARTKSFLTRYSLQTQPILSFPFDFSKSLIFLTNRVARQLTTAVLSDLEFDGWKPQSTHMGIVADLLRQDGIPQQDLAISTIKDKGTITRGLQGLEREGVLKRQIDPQDRRNKLIFLTEKGRCLHATMQPCIAKTMEVATKGIKDENLNNCIEVLHQIYTNLQENINPTSKIDEPGNHTLD